MKNINVFGFRYILLLEPAEGTEIHLNHCCIPDYFPSTLKKLGYKYIVILCIKKLAVHIYR